MLGDKISTDQYVQKWYGNLCSFFSYHVGPFLSLYLNYRYPTYDSGGWRKKIDEKLKSSRLKREDIFNECDNSFDNIETLKLIKFIENVRELSVLGVSKAAEAAKLVRLSRNDNITHLSSPSADDLYIFHYSMRSFINSLDTRSNFGSKIKPEVINEKKSQLIKRLDEMRSEFENRGDVISQTQNNAFKFKFDRVKTFNFCRVECLKKNIDLDKNFYNVSSATDVNENEYFFDVNPNRLYRNWVIILGDQVRGILYVFLIPAETLKEEQFERKKSTTGIDLLHFYIRYDDVEHFFSCKTKLPKIEFKKWLVDTIELTVEQKEMLLK